MSEIVIFGFVKKRQIRRVNLEISASQTGQKRSPLSIEILVNGQSLRVF